MGSHMASSLTLGLVIALSLWHSVLSFMNGNGAFWCAGRGRTETMKTERMMASSISTGTDFEVIVLGEVVNDILYIYMPVLLELMLMY